MRFRPSLICILVALLPLAAADKQPKPGKWVSMFNGKNLDGWKANENPESWSVDTVDNVKVIKGNGKSSHLFWMKAECVNCEFKADVNVADHGNSGMYFRTAFGPGFPKGYEAQVNATHSDPIKTGSLYGFTRILEAPHKPGEWFTQEITVQGNHIVIKVNGKVTTDIVDPKNTYTKGFLALQQHDPGTLVYFKNLMYRKLPD